MNQSSVLPKIHVDPTNPGQFFACCGLLDLADRLWGGAEGWFEGNDFLFRPLDIIGPVEMSMSHILREISTAPLRQLDADDDYSSAVEIASPFNLRLDWWNDDQAGGSLTKVWAGSMRSLRIARAMQSALQSVETHNYAMLDHGMVVYDPLEPDKKVEPFYFDARRGSSAQAIDIGFSPDSLRMTTIAYPAVEFLCLVGLQRFRPRPTKMRRVFDYYIWGLPLAASIAASAVCGLLVPVEGRRFRFENAFRTDQKKHKAFTAATPIARS